MTSANVHVVDDRPSHGSVVMNGCPSDPNLVCDMQVDNCMEPRLILDISSDATSGASNLHSRPGPSASPTNGEINHLEGSPTIAKHNPIDLSNSEFLEIDLQIDRKTHISENKEDLDFQGVKLLTTHLDVNEELSTTLAPSIVCNYINTLLPAELENELEMPWENTFEKVKSLEDINSLPEVKKTMHSSDFPIGQDHHSSSPLKGIHTHPAYKTVIQELINSKEQIALLNKKISKLELENHQIKADANSSQEVYKMQLESLDKTINQQQRELCQLSELNQQQAETSSKSYNQMKHDLEAQLERVTKMYDSANKDREATVMRYAVSEKDVIGLRKERESLDKRMKEVIKEKDLLIGKLKSLTGEKDRVSQVLDLKCHELTKVQKDNEKIKEDLNSREIKIKWAQNKLCTEMETHKETQAKLDKLTKKLQDTKEESEQVHRDCQAMMKTFQTSEENKAFTLGQQLKEQQATLIMERHERQDREESLRQLSQEVDVLKGKHQLIINENNLLSIKVQNLEKERLEYEQNLSKLKRTTDDQRQDVVDLRSQLAEMESIRIQLQHEQEKLSASHGEVERLRLSNTELQQDMAACREREAELLDFTQKLTDKNVRLQSEFSATEAKAQQLECELGPQLKHASELESRVSSLSQQLDRELKQRLVESQLLARHLAEKTQHADSLAQQLEDQVGENQVLKRKQAATVKELMRELNQARKRLELSETLSGITSLGHSSRASSSTSLNTLEPTLNPSNNTVKLGVVSTEITSNGSEHSSGPLEPDRQLLIERIVKLQRANARKTEKLEFMEEHSRQLVAELQKKTRVVQNYIMREQTGALSSASMDRNKAEVTRHGGIMASVYGSKALDDNMTLELSLEINRKLQAVLEDTLLKNITLKESIDTLGAEISRLQQESREKT